MYRRCYRAILLLLIIFATGTSALNMVEMCSYVSEMNELQISVECLESMVELDNYYREPREFMEALQRVERRVKEDLPLSSNENIIWVMVRDKMRHMVLAGMTREFVTKTGDPAACAIVRALGSRYGFCTYLYLLGLRHEEEEHGNEHENNFYSSRIIRNNSGTNSTTKNGVTNNSDNNTTSIGSKEVTLVIYLDLFNMKCDPAALQALCSEYCCGPHQADTIFCNSRLPCY